MNGNGKKSYSDSYCIDFISDPIVFKGFQLFIKFVFEVNSLEELELKFGFKPCDSIYNQDPFGVWKMLQEFLEKGLFALSAKNFINNNQIIS